MSFSGECKNEICMIKMKDDEDAAAALHAFARSGGTLSIGKDCTLLLASENHEVIRWAAQLMQRLYGLEPALLMRESPKLGGLRSHILTLEGEEARALLEDCGVINDSGRLRVQRRRAGATELGGERVGERALHSLRGAFLAVGSVSDPGKGYHLEMVFRREDWAQEILAYMEELGVSAKITPRKEHHVVYLKESEKIAAFLGMLGAHSAVLRLEEVWVLKNLRNTLNRQVNCETANLQKTATAAARQIHNIEWLMKQEAFQALSPSLREAAHLRLQYPDATLAELGGMIDPPVGKSGINHRLRKLDELARELRG